MSINEAREAIIARANFVCELCYGPLTIMSLHHRRPRGMGGTKSPWIHDPENLLALCGTGTSGCHGKVESYRDRAYRYGWLVRYGTIPHSVIFADLYGKWWLLREQEKIEINLPFEHSNPSSIRPHPSVGLNTTPREESNEY